jgi:hypothetical protein
MITSGTDHAIVCRVGIVSGFLSNSGNPGTELTRRIDRV